MADFIYNFDRRKIFFTDHALDRFWERCEANNISGRKAAITELKKQLDLAEWSREVPAWTRLSLFHRARAEGAINLDEESAFIINKNSNGDYVAVTFLQDD